MSSFVKILLENPPSMFATIFLLIVLYSVTLRQEMNLRLYEPSSYKPLEFFNVCCFAFKAVPQSPPRCPGRSVTHYLTFRNFLEAAWRFTKKNLKFH